MSSKQQTCLTESKSTVFHNLWQIHNFKCEHVKQWKSDVFYGYSTHSSGCEVSWHYTLTAGSYVEVIDGQNRLTVRVKLGYCIDSCDTSVDVQVELCNNQNKSFKTDGKTSVGSNFKMISMPKDELLRYFLKNETLTMRLKVTIIVDAVPQDSQLANNFMSLLTNEALSDVTILVGPEKFFAQKAILSVRSAVFAAMFQSGMQESRLNHLVVEDIEPEVFKELLCFIYVGKVDRLGEMAHELLAAADKYALDGLRRICGYHLLGSIEKETVLKTLALADLYHAAELKKQAVQFVCANIESMKKTDWKSFSRSHPDLVAEILSAMTI